MMLPFLQGVSVGRRRLSADFQLLFRLIKGSIFLTFLATFIILIAVAKMTIKDIVVCILAVMPTGWGLLLVSFHILSVAFVFRGILYKIEFSLLMIYVVLIMYS